MPMILKIRIIKLALVECFTLSCSASNLRRVFAVVH
jgi:hypothetical protein